MPIISSPNILKLEHYHDFKVEMDKDYANPFQFNSIQFIIQILIVLKTS